MKNEVLSPWTAVKGTKREGLSTINVWGREYVFAGKALPVSILTQNKELLANPVRLVGLENNREIEWKESGNYFVIENDTHVILNGYQQSDLLILNTTVKAEFDGFVKIDIKVMPKGLTVPQVFGLEKKYDEIRSMQRLWLEIPLRKNIATLYHAWPCDNGILANNEERTAMKGSGSIPSYGMSMTYKPSMWFGNEDVGLGIYSGTDRNWRPRDEMKAIEVINKNDEVLVRLHLLDSEYDSWKGNTDEAGIRNEPITYSIAILATPVKPFKEDYINLNIVHIDCFKKIKGDYNPFLKGKVSSNDDEIVIDRLKRLGTNVLVLHEKWNDIQNHWLTNKEKDEDIKEIVSMCHERNIKVLAYFGYEISTSAPEWAEYSDKVVNIPPSGKKSSGWYRIPSQRATPVCYNSEWQSKWLNGIVSAVEKFNLDGVYLDSTVRPLPCINEAHGCGYRTSKGELKPTYPVFEIREMFKKLYTYIHNRGGIINVHPYDCLFIPAIAYSDLYWDGEQIQVPLLKGKLDEFSLDYFRAEYTGRNIGVPCQFIVYENQPIWTFRKALSLSVIHGIYPRPNDIMEPLEIMAPIWKALSEFDVANSKWHPYWGDNDILDVDNDDIIVSYYEKKDVKGKPEYMIVLSNPFRRLNENVVVKFRESVSVNDMNIIDILEETTVNSSDNCICLDFDEFTFKMLHVFSK